MAERPWYRPCSPLMAQNVQGIALKGRCNCSELCFLAGLFCVCLLTTGCCLDCLPVTRISVDARCGSVGTDVFPGLMLSFLSTRGSRRMAANLEYWRSVGPDVRRNVALLVVNYSSRNSSWNLAPSGSFPSAPSSFGHSRGGRRRLFASYDLTAKFYFALGYFVRETKFRWFWRGTDDAIVNFLALRNFSLWLDEAHDPLREFVVYGHCVSAGKISYLQGGSGWVMSRRAAEEVLPFYNWTMTNMHWPDDVMFGVVLDKFFRDRFSLRTATSPYFLGHSPGGRGRSDLFTGRFARLKTCPGRFFCGSCSSIVPRWRNVVFFHEQWQGLTLRGSLRHSRVVFSLSETLAYYTEGPSVIPCRA